MLDNKFLDKVCDQIISETSVNDNDIHLSFLPHFISPTYLSSFFFTNPFFLHNFIVPPFSSHCKEVYTLNEQETEYVWTKYKEEVKTIINKKELIH
jgi:hypothetical protein